MPTISSFYRIMVRMYRSDHNPPHFHARYAGDEVEMNIRGGAWQGRLPQRALAMLQAWRKAHVEELPDNWNRAQVELPLQRIAPLE